MPRKLKRVPEKDLVMSDIDSVSFYDKEGLLGFLRPVYLMGADIITAPFKILKEWADNGMQIPGPDYVYPKGELKEIPYQEISLDKPWQEYEILHEMTDAGLEKFSTDWNNLIA